MRLMYNSLGASLIDGIVVSQLDVRQPDIPIVLTLADRYRERPCHAMVINSFCATVGLRVGAGGNLSGTQNLVDMIEVDSLEVN